jgi:hypothetical protein
MLSITSGTMHLAVSSHTTSLRVTARLIDPKRFLSTCFLCITSIWRENNVADQPPGRFR